MATPMIDPRADRRANLLVQFLRAQGNRAAKDAILAEAALYDAAHPREDSLRDELCAAVAGDPVGVA